MTFAPPAVVLLALACGVIPLVGLPAARLVIGATRAPGRRMRWAAGLALAAWSIGTAAVAVSAQGTHWADVLAGALILSAALLASFTLWSLLAWGFTLSLLLHLADAGRPISAEDLMARYGGGGPEEFARNRAKILLAAALCVPCPDGVAPSWPGARLLGALARGLQCLFGMPVP